MMKILVVATFIADGKSVKDIKHDVEKWCKIQNIGDQVNDTVFTDFKIVKGEVKNASIIP